MIDPIREGTLQVVWVTNSIQTIKDHAFTAHLIADVLQPGKKYQYQLYVDSQLVQITYPLSFMTQPLWQWRGDPPDYSFLAGSCVYIGEEAVDRPGNPYGGEYEMFTQMAKEKGEMMVWLGDNIYLREVDWNSKTGIYHRYSEMRKLPELQPLLGQMHHYAIWDDHDYGPNDSDWSYWGKDMTLEAFKDFWANPNYHVGGSEGITGTFFWNDCQFFMMDNRWYRSPQDDEGQVLGNVQLKWLIDALRYSTASFKFICIGGQVLSDLKKYENYAVFENERITLLKAIQEYKIEGVVFLTGDRHHSEISRLELGDGQILYDITASPLTSGSYDHSDETNTNRVPNSIIGERNYALLNVSGSLGERVLNIQFKNKLGEILFDYTIEN